MTKPIKPDDYPSNSKTVPNKPEKKKAVTKAVMLEREKPFLARIFGENMRQVGVYVLWDVLIPAAKNTISEIISNGIEMMLYGEPDARSGKSSRIRRERDRSYVSYHSMYDKPQPRTQMRSRHRSRHDFSDIIIETRPDAEDVLTVLVESVDTYGSCTVADLYEAVGLQTEFTDHKWGWYNLAAAEVKRNRFGYILSMPEPEPLE